jgi:hypothetical protein
MSERDLPADALLLRERQRRMVSPTPAAESRPATDEGLESVLLESDAIVDERPDAASEREGAVEMYCPLATVTLAQLSWTGAIDHDALQTAIACAPTRTAGGPALYVALDPGEAALLESARARYDAGTAQALALAASLPATIAGADASTVDAAEPVLAAYRRASLVYAWRSAIVGEAGTDETSRRDEAAAQLMSLLRALLGEA